MKKVLVSMLVVGLVMSSGCATMWNSNRVKQNMVKDRIAVSGTQEQKIAVARGVKPTSALAIIPTQDAKGAYIALNWFAVPSFMETFSEAPASTIGAIIVDAGLVGLATYAVMKAGDNDSSTKGNTPSNNGTGNSNVDVQSGDNSPVNVTVHNGDSSSVP